MKFVDEACIEIHSGKGGDGAVSFRREKNVPRGGPDGGDGGSGGSVCAVADRNINTLVEYRFARIHRARDGERGRGAQCNVKGADDVVLRVPTGTVITNAETGETVAGKATPGEPGEHRTLKLELKVLADIGLLGLPNAGKSTFIRAVSAARPKVADYPFTTLHPHLGVVRVGIDRSFVIADIPGLIEGAAEGAGLGHQFLRHLARTRLLLHIVDVAPFDPDADPARDARSVAAELKKFDPALHRKARWLVLNKMDMLPAEERETAAAALVRRLRWRGPSFCISALTGEGCRELSFAVMKFLETGKAA